GNDVGEPVSVEVAGLDLSHKLTRLKRRGTRERAGTGVQEHRSRSIAVASDQVEVEVAIDIRSDQRGRYAARAVGGLGPEDPSTHVAEHPQTSTTTSEGLVPRERDVKVGVAVQITHDQRLRRVRGRVRDRRDYERPVTLVEQHAQQADWVLCLRL